MTKESQPIILVVEDNPGQQKVLHLLAEKFGFTALIVSSGREALDVLSACETCFDAILMDWKMPDMDGLECARQIRIRDKQNTPIIAVTAYNMPDAMAKCKAAGMDDYLSKPFTADDFRRMLLKWTYKPSRPNLKLLPGESSEASSY